MEWDGTSVRDTSGVRPVSLTDVPLGRFYKELKCYEFLRQEVGLDFDGN